MKSSHIWLAAIAFLSAGCSPSLIPKIDATRVHVPELQHLEPRSLSLQVVDKRSPAAEGSVETVAEIERVIHDRMKAAHVEVQDDSRNSLLVEIHHWENAPQGFPAKYCVNLKAYLSLPSFDSPGWADGSACFAMKHLLTGATIPTNPNQSYESSLTTTLRGLDEVLERSFGDRI